MEVRNNLPTHFHRPYQRPSIAFQQPSLPPPYTPRGVGRRWNAPLRTGLNALHAGACREEEAGLFFVFVLPPTARSVRAHRQFGAFCLAASTNQWQKPVRLRIKGCLSMMTSGLRIRLTTMRYD